MGFDGKTLIHPNQIDSSNAFFSASEDELNEARDIVEAWEEANRLGLGVVLVNDRLVEQFYVVEAQGKLEIAEILKRR